MPDFDLLCDWNDLYDEDVDKVVLEKILEIEKSRLN